MSICSGCVGTDELLSGSQEDFISELEEYELAHEGEIPKSVLDTLDFMLENYTNGLQKPDIDDIDVTQIDDDSEKDIDYGEDVSKDSARQKIVDALTNLESSVAFKLEKDIYSHEYLYELIYGDICEDYMIESMRLTSYSYTYYPDISGKDICINLFFEYAYPKEKMREMREQTRAKAQSIVNQLQLDGKSDYEKTVAVNKYLCDTIVYSAGKPPFEPFQHSSYGALIKGDCVCEGYARAARILLSLCGVECLYVTGETPESGHAWNLVKIAGNYYQLDVTWNDADGSPNQYFLVTDDYMSLSRTWNRSKYPKTPNKPYSN